MQSIKEQLLGRCTEVLSDIAKTNPDNFYGTPPVTFYILYGKGEKDKFGVYTLLELEETYKFENGQLIIVENDVKFKKKPVSGMYFSEGYAELGIDLKQSIAFFNYAVGPRYGNGLCYEIIESEDGEHLGKEKLLWLS